MLYNYAFISQGKLLSLVMFTDHEEALKLRDPFWSKAIAIGFLLCQSICILAERSRSKEVMKDYELNYLYFLLVVVRIFSRVFECQLLVTFHVFLNVNCLLLKSELQ